MNAGAGNSLRNKIFGLRVETLLIAADPPSAVEHEEGWIGARAIRSEEVEQAPFVLGRVGDVAGQFHNEYSDMGQLTGPSHEKDMICRQNEQFLIHFLEKGEIRLPFV